VSNSYTTELRDIIDRAFTAEYGGRATAQMVHNSVHRDLPGHLVDYLIGKGLRSQITAYFNAKSDDGLPKRPEANQDGEHAQLELLSVQEYAYVHGRYIERSRANRVQAERLRQRCLDTHGVDVAAASAAQSA
jgi:hypothetical protein